MRPSPRLGTLLGALVVLAGGAPPALAVDVVAYRFGFEVTDSDDLVRGDAQLDVRLDGERTIELDLESMRTDGLGMRVGSVEWLPRGGEPIALDYRHESSQLHVSHPTWSGTVTVRVRYSGKPSDGFLIGVNRHGDRTFFADHWPNRAHLWLPVVDHPSDKALCSFDVTAPSHYQVVGCGALREETDLGDGRRRTVWASRAPMATKVMAVGVARFAVETVGYVDDVPVQTWVFPQDREAGFSDYARALPVLHFFSEKIGEYPYSKLANVQSKTRWGGLENASNVFYNETSVRGDGSSEGLIAHELAHQWFGDAVSESDWHHVWLSEGFATYLTQVYLEFAHGRDRMLSGMETARKRVLSYARSNPDAKIIDRTIEDPNRQLSAYTYQKGAWVLHMLRARMGDRAFFETLRTFYAMYRDANASTEDFIRIAEASSGEDLTVFFAQWLERPGHPLLRVATREVEGRTEIVVQQEQEGSFRFPVTIETVDAEGKTERQVLKLSSPRAAVSVDGIGLTVRLDPDVELLYETVPKPVR